MMNRRIIGGSILLMLAMCLGLGTIANSGEKASATPAPSPTDGSAEGVQERGVFPRPSENVFEHPKALPTDPTPTPPLGNPPPQLCHTETVMLTQYKYFNQAEYQALTALFPNSCPAGSQHCEFVPMARGTMPPLPPTLCGYQTPLTLTKCACHNQAECSLLSPFCPGSCPPGSQSCTCQPMRRGT